MVMTFRPSLAPAMHMFIGALHLYRAQYGEAVKELDCACDPAASEPEQNVHQAVVRIGVMIARLIIEEGHVNDVGAVLQACAAILRVFDALVRDSMSGSSADFRRSTSRRTRFLSYFTCSRSICASQCRRSSSIGKKQIVGRGKKQVPCNSQPHTPLLTVEQLLRPAWLLVSTVRLKERKIRHSTFARQQAIEELYSEELELGLLALNAILPVLAKASSSSILTQVQMSETVTNDVIGLLKALVES
jgi:hypothetical protein